MASKAKGRKGKIGRKKGQILAYYNQNRREKSHIRRITKHLKKFPDDATAQERLKVLKAVVGMRS